VYMWMPIAVWGVIGLLRAVIGWGARVGYERARAASIVAVLRAAPTGRRVLDRHADGTMLYVAAAQEEVSKPSGTHGDPVRGKPC
jgi:hypothetical protein